MRPTSVKTKSEHYQCTHCNAHLSLGNGITIGHYKKEYANKPFWYCDNTKHGLVYVACHKDTVIPLGFAGDYNLRQLRLDAHKSFDSLWSGRTAHMRRKDAYIWLANKLNIPSGDCHIGWFDCAECQTVVDLISDYWFNKDEL